MPISLSTFSHDQYSNVNVSPTQKSKFQREETTIQESVEDDDKKQISPKATNDHQLQQQQKSHSITITSNQDDSVSFYSTPLNGTKNDSTSSSSSGLNEEQLAKFLNTVETCSSGSISPCSKVFNELSANNGDSQLLVTASEGESSLELDPATENTIINGAVEMSYDKELDLLENSATNQIPFSIKKMVFVMEDKEKHGMTSENEDQLLSENISPRTSLSNDSANEHETSVPSSNLKKDEEVLTTVLSPSLTDVRPEEIFDDFGSAASFGKYVDHIELITPESLSIPHEHESVCVQHQLEKDTINLINEEASIKYSNIEEEEVNELVNKIVVDVITHAAHADQLGSSHKQNLSLLPQTQTDKDSANVIIGSAHDTKINSIENVNGKVFIKAKEDKDIVNMDAVSVKNNELKIDEIVTNQDQIENDDSVLVEISSKEIDSILKKSEHKDVESVETKSVEKKEAKSTAKKDANKKDAVVDCFSCSIV